MLAKRAESKKMSIRGAKVLTFAPRIDIFTFGSLSKHVNVVFGKNNAVCGKLKTTPAKTNQNFKIFTVRIYFQKSITRERRSLDS